MTVLAYGSKAVVGRIESLLVDRGVKVMAIANNITNPKYLRSLDKFDELDLVVVDTDKTGAELLCRYFGKLRHIPVVLLVNGNKADWAKICLHEASAYIPRGAGNAELAARLKNVLERTSGWGKC